MNVSSGWRSSGSSAATSGRYVKISRNGWKHYVKICVLNDDRPKQINLLNGLARSSGTLRAVMPVRAWEGVSPIPTAEHPAGFFFYDSEAI